MNNADTTIPMATPPVSSSSDSRPQEELLQRGAFDPPFTPGTLGRLDRFEILRLLGEGGMGQVYLAREPRTDTQVAVKIMRPQVAGDPQSVHRFLTEARHMYRLSHPRILRVLEVSDREDGPYFVMPYIEGGSLLDQCRSGRCLPEDRVLAIARQVAEALAHAHARGLIHRDLKPGNVLLDKEGNAYLTDFGLVRTVFNDSMIDASASHLEGTAPYMSPAVARGEAEDTRCDIYAFGALLYELLTGQPPYTGRTPQLILDQVLKGPPQPIRAVSPKASPALVRIAEGCLARELRDRYASMSDVVADLERIEQGKMPLGVHGGHGVFRAGKRFWAAVGLATLLGGALFGAARFAGGRASVARPANLDRDAPLFSCVTNNGAVTVTGYLGTEADVAIPERIGGQPVTGIADQAFKSCTILKEIVVPASVATVGREAFAGCVNLESAFFKGDAPGGGSYASLFEGDKKVTVYYTPGAKGWQDTYGGRPTFSRVGDFAVGMSSNAVTILKYAGWAPDVIIPDTICGKPVTTIGDNAFFACGHLRKVTLPRPVTSIGFAAFYACPNLITLDLQSTNLFIGNQSFAWCGNLTGSLSFDGVIGIDTGAFWNCRSLTHVYIPSDMTFLGGNPFSACSSLQAIDVAEANPVFVGVDGSLFSKDKKTLLCSPGSRHGCYRIPMGTEVLGPWSIGDSEGLASVVLPDSITNIGYHAFVACRRLERIVVPQHVTSIGNAAFKHCQALICVDFKGDAPTVEGEPFDNAPHVIVRHFADAKGWGPTFGGRPTAVWQDAPAASSQPSALSLQPSASQVPFNYTTNNGAITITKYTGPGGEVSIPSAINGLPVTGIGDSSFLGCAGLTNITIPNGITTIGYHAFWGCTGLTNVTIPKSVTAIGVGLFNACHGLTSISVDEANTTYCSSSDGVLFDKAKTSLVSFPGGRDGSYKIPDSVKSISDAAFDSCTRLTSVTIPNNVTTIGIWAFGNCSSLMAVYFNGNAPSLDKDVFTRTDKTTVYYRPGTKGWGKEFGGRPTAVWQDAPADSSRPTASHPKTHGPFTYTVDNGTITITKYTGPGGEVVVPSEIDGHPVRSFGEGAFSSCVGLCNITIPNSVISIGPCAFADCTGLTHVVIPENVTCLAAGSFGGCSRLTSILVDPKNPAYSSDIDGVVFSKDKTSLVCYPSGKSGAYAIPAGVRQIEPGAFHANRWLTDVTIPDGVTRVEGSTFPGCTSLANVTIPESVTSIGGCAFRGCTSLTRMVMPRGVTNVEHWAFLDAAKLSGVYFEGNAPTFKGEPFFGVPDVTVYYRSGTKGWGETFGGRPTKVWKE